MRSTLKTENHLASGIVLTVGLVACLSPFAGAQELSTELLFAEGLQGRGYFDLAEKHLESLLADRTVPTRDRAAVHYRFAELLEDMATDVVKRTRIPMLDRLQLREGYLGKAEDNWRKGLRMDPTHEKAPNARFAIGIILKTKAQTNKRNWQKLSDELDRLGEPSADTSKMTPEQRAEEAKNQVRRQVLKRQVAKEKKDALGFLNDSVKYFTDMSKEKERDLKRIRDQVQRERRPDMLAKLDKEEKKTEEVLVRARFEWYANLVFLAEIVGDETPAGQKHLTDAAKNLKSLGANYSNWVIGKYAVMLEGYANCLLNQYAPGFRKFEEVIGEEENEYLNDVVQKTYYRFADCAFRADSKYYPKNYRGQYEMVVYMLEGLVYRVSAAEAKSKIGLKEIAPKFGRDPGTLMKLNKMQSYVVKAGQKIHIYRGLFARFDGIEEEPIGKAATLLLAEAYVKWGLQGKAQKRPVKEWRGKVRGGLGYAEKIAQGNDAWAYKANTLLAKWSDLMREVQYVSPAQLYAEATTAFFEARQTKKGPKQDELFRDAIFYFQRVIDVCEGPGRTRKAILDEEKVVDSWFKMAACYYVMGRVQEAALCWNACARYFPTDPKAEKGSYLSTSVMGKRYREATKDRRRTLGHFYGEMLRDFIRLFPDNDKAPNAQFYFAEVLRGRGDYLEAAPAYEQVPGVCLYYDQALYLIGICYQNEFYTLYKGEQGESDEAKVALEAASNRFQTFIRWTDQEEAPDEGSARKRIELQAKAVLNRAKIYLFPVVENPDRVIELTASYVEDYASALSESARKTLFPDAIFTRLKAFVMKEDLPGAIKELDRLLKYPESKDLVNGFKYVAGVYMKEAGKKDEELEGPKKEAEEKQAKVDELRKAEKVDEAGALEKELEPLKTQIAQAEKEAGKLRVNAADLYYRLVCAAPKQDPSIYLFTADTYFVNEIYEKSADSYARYLKLYENDPNPKVKAVDIKGRLAESLYHVKQYEKALPLFEVVEAAYLAAGTQEEKNKRYAIKPMMSHCHKAAGLNLAQSEDPDAKAKSQEHFVNALKGWGMLKNGLQPLTDEWWEAVYEIGQVLSCKGDYQNCLTHLGSHILMYPQMGGANWKPKFLALAKSVKEQCKEKSALSKVEELIDKLSK